jgi:hypothetical protein
MLPTDMKICDILPLVIYVDKVTPNDFQTLLFSYVDEEYLGNSIAEFFGTQHMERLVPDYCESLQS